MDPGLWLGFVFQEGWVSRLSVGTSLADWLIGTTVLGRRIGYLS
jgi:hypothetical protein